MMKKVFCIFPLLLVCAAVPGGEPEESPESAGDRYYGMRGAMKDGVVVSEYIEKAIDNYSDAIRKEPSDEELLYKYIKAVDFKYNYLVKDNEEKKDAYLEAIDMIEDKYEYSEESVYINYSLALLWGRYGQLIDLFKAARSGIAGKIRKYAGNVYREDPEFYDGVGALMLGRLHYKTPKIPLILSWPDLGKSEKYLKEVVDGCPESFLGRFYYADTLYRLGRCDEALEYYRDIADSEPSAERTLEDSCVKGECREILSDILK